MSLVFLFFMLLVFASVLSAMSRAARRPADYPARQRAGRRKLDPALLRGGRLSSTIVLGLPDEPGRRAILGVYTARMPTVGVDLDRVAERTQGFSPADVKALCQEAALAAMTRSGDASVLQEDFDAAIERLGRRTPVDGAGPASLTILGNEPSTDYLENSRSKATNVRRNARRTPGASSSRSKRPATPPRGSYSTTSR